MTGEQAVLPIRCSGRSPRRLAASCCPGLPLEQLRHGRSVPAFIDLIDAGAPELVNTFEPVRRALGSSRERAAVERVYAKLGQVNFRARARAGGGSLDVRRSGCEWSDWGNAERVFATIRRTGWRPGVERGPSSMVA
jgi:hypothetical protein